MIAMLKPFIKKFIGDKNPSDIINGIIDNIITKIANQENCSKDKIDFVIRIKDENSPALKIFYIRDEENKPIKQIVLSDSDIDKIVNDIISKL